MNQAEVYQYLTEHGIDYEVTNHPAVFDMAAVADFPMPHPEANAKTSLSAMTSTAITT